MYQKCRAITPFAHIHVKTCQLFTLMQAGDPCAIQCRAMVAVGVVSAQGNGIWDFPNCPTLTEARISCTRILTYHTSLTQVSSMVSECEWGEELVEMEVWVRLAELALRNKEDSLVSLFNSHSWPLYQHPHCRPTSVLVRQWPSNCQTQHQKSSRK